MSQSTSLQPLAELSPGRGLEGYIQAVNKISLLTLDEEWDLAKRLYYDNDLEAARRLVMAHLRFVVHIARSYSGYGLAQADLIQEGNVGLMKAVKRFDPNVGVRLVSFAIHWIKAEIHEFILRNWRIVKVATTKAQRKLFFNLRSAKKRLGWLSNTEAEAIARDLGVERCDVFEMETRLHVQDSTFDAATDEDEDQAWQAPVNQLEDRRYDPAAAAEADNYETDTHGRLHEALQSLDARSQDIIAKRWLTEDKATLHELASEYGISAERIRQLEQSAMSKVKQSLAGSR